MVSGIAITIQHSCVVGGGCCGGGMLVVHVCVWGGGGCRNFVAPNCRVGARHQMNGGAGAE
jgi:hypothetical protein